MTSYYVFVSTEDDKRLVKGGIGTYLGLLVSVLGEIRPDCEVDWVTQAPGATDFTEEDRNVRRHYLSRVAADGADLPLTEYSEVVDSYVTALCDRILSAGEDRRIYVEAPDWEGLLATYFTGCTDRRVLKISRVHSPLSVCLPYNELELTAENRRQLERERRQMLESDILSAPTRYMLEAATAHAFRESDRIPPAVVIPSGLDTHNFGPGHSSRAEALTLLGELAETELPHSASWVFVVGSLELRKGVRIVQRAVPGILSCFPDARFCFIGHYRTEGEGDLTANSKLTRREVLEMVPDHCRDRIHFAGYVDHALMPRILAGGDLFLFCYLCDNFPNALAEVALTERPLVALLRGGIPEMLCVDGRCLAMTIPDGPEEVVGDRLVAIVRDHRSNPENGFRLASKLRSHLLRSFSPETVGDRMAETYRCALERKLAGT